MAEKITEILKFNRLKALIEMVNQRSSSKTNIFCSKFDALNELKRSKKYGFAALWMNWNEDEHLCANASEILFACT